MRLRYGLLSLAALGMAFLAGSARSQPNGFQLEPSAVPVDQILAGGPPRDGIPALTDPDVVAASKASWKDDEVVLGVEAGGEARAYPLSILVWHEIVNDTLGGKPLLVSYCPLCGTGMVFERPIHRKGARAKPMTFGVSGLLYRSDLLLYDRETESLWSQISSEAVTGPSMGRRLRLLRSRMMSWGDWRRLHPSSEILSRNTGYDQPYGRSPYGDYAQSKRLSFPVKYDRSYHPKMPTIGLRVPGTAARAYPAAELVAAGGEVRERFAGHPVRIRFDPDQEVFDVEAPSEVEIVEAYWFAWMAFHPETTVFKAAER